jgi:hypothetical protein
MAMFVATISFVKFTDLISSTLLKIYGAMKDNEATLASRKGSVYIGEDAFPINFDIATTKFATTPYLPHWSRCIA